MKRTLTAALALALLLPAATVAEDPQVVCTRIELPPEHPAAGAPELAGEPASGECDILVYLPPVAADGLAMRALTTRLAEEAEQRKRDEAREELANVPCETLWEMAGGDIVDYIDASDEQHLAADVYVERCMTCAEHSEAPGDNVVSITARFASAYETCD